MRAIGRILTILALSSAIGLDWCAFQSVGWAMMLVEHAKHAPFKQALIQTFDGQHPCAICHAVAARKKSEKKNDLHHIASIDLFCSPPSEPSVCQFQFVDYENPVSPLLKRGDPPLSPPPRSRSV